MVNNLATVKAPEDRSMKILGSFYSIAITRMQDEQEATHRVSCSYRTSQNESFEEQSWWFFNADTPFLF